jgi:hypothetical protein
MAWPGGIAGGGIAALVLLILFWDWNWFPPMVEARMSSALGRSVSIDRLEVHPGRLTHISLFGVKASNSIGFDGTPSAVIQRIGVASAEQCGQE